MREQLVGYLLDALDASERDEVETALGSSAALRTDLERLSAALAPLAADGEPFSPPPGLAERTIAAVADYRARGLRDLV
jgi:anti-sigma-K factor RskA